MPLVQLTHFCNHPRCSGQPGDKLDLPDDLVRYLVDRGGAVLVQPGRANERKRTAAAGVETTETDEGAKPDEPPAAASAREARRRRGRKERSTDETPAPTGDGDEAPADEGDPSAAE